MLKKRQAMHELKNCPRCGKAFECRVGDITNCQCYGIQLSLEEECFITEHYPGQCLCSNCLHLLQSRYHLFLENKIYYNQR